MNRCGLRSDKCETTVARSTLLLEMWYMHTIHVSVQILHKCGGMKHEDWRYNNEPYLFSGAFAEQMGVTNNFKCKCKWMGISMMRLIDWLEIFIRFIFSSVYCGMYWRLLKSILDNFNNNDLFGWWTHQQNVQSSRNSWLKQLNYWKSEEIILSKLNYLQMSSMKLMFSNTSSRHVDIPETATLIITNDVV